MSRAHALILEDQYSRSIDTPRKVAREQKQNPETVQRCYRMPIPFRFRHYSVLRLPECHHCDVQVQIKGSFRVDIDIVRVKISVAPCALLTVAILTISWDLEREDRTQYTE